jgi:formylglycine-generating enzyme required for sulfatase activity
MNKLALCEISFLCAVALSYSQTIDITGTVESAGTALAGATIKLKAAGIQTTSDATGKYILASTAAQMQTPGRFSSSLTPALRADCVTFSIGAEQPVSIDLCTVSGDLVYAAISSRLFQSGSYSVPIANVALAEGAYIVRVKIGSRETALRYFALSAKSGAQFVRGVRSDNSFSKRAAFADTLLCQHSGFASESLAVTSATGTHDFSLTALQNGPGMKLISAGTFTMGSSSSFNAKASPPHPVTLAAFYMDTTEVTQAQYKAVMSVNPANFVGDLTRPIEQVTWYDAVLYCNARSKLEGKDTVYAFTAISGTAGNGCTGLANLSYAFANTGYRLPTDAEWEYACRAGTTTMFYWGDDSTAATVGQYCWYFGNSGGTTHPVATKKPNAWGLYDMGGNVWQWCNDYFSSYTSASQTNPTGAATGNNRCLRGGSWTQDNGLVYISSAGRDPGNTPGSTTNRRGFRSVHR